MASFHLAVWGLGNIGRCVIEAAQTAPDCRCLGVIRRKESLGTNQEDLRGVPEYSTLEALIEAQGKPDVVVLCGPSRQVGDQAEKLLSMGISAVDSFDIHHKIVDMVNRLDPVAKAHQAVAITAAGWDPGSDSMLRAIFEAMAPAGTTFTNFGRGRSMGHSVAARSIEGVADAVSITIPIGGGRHSRLVYVVLASGVTLPEVRKRIQEDDYFSHDPLDVIAVTAEELPYVADQSHGVFLERIGASGLTNNQRLSFDMRIDNPAMTAQILVSSARAATRLSAGCYTLIDIPLVSFLPGDRMRHIARLV